ncbi:MAG TPA: hypothetical protein VJ951_01045, partial [Bacteroidales bacterium]|nr:hypothetical protein [Bacteroidales bacterium]
MRYLTILIFILISVISTAQDYSTDSRRAIKNYETAMEHFRNRDDGQAEQYLRRAIHRDPEFIEAWFTLAQIYLDKQQGVKAVQYYLKGLEVNPELNPNGFLQVANIEYNYGIYLEAKKHLDTWKTYGIKEQRWTKLASKLEVKLDFAISAVQNPVPFTPMPLSNAINSGLSEYWPSLSVDEKTMFFTVLGPQNRDMKPTNLKQQEDFYYANFENGQWMPRKKLGPPVNTNYNEGAQSITADGSVIYFTACNRPGGHGRMCDLYYSNILDNGSWSKPVNLGDVINTGRSEKHPSISADGRMIIFTSNRGGGKGDYDLWMSMKSDNRWTKPVNLGDSINTEGIEQSPFLHPDQKSLYFSSDGWPGLGRGDIFVSRLKDDGSWSTPKNLGYPVNSHNDEVGFTVNARGTTAYYATSRNNGMDIDIYTFDLPPEVQPNPVSYISGRVFDADNMRGIEAEFLL